MPLTTTMGQLLVNEALPEDMRDYRRVMSKKTMQSVLADVARTRPDKYVDIVDRLMRVGRSTVEAGNFSLSLKDFKPPAYKKTRVLVLKSMVNKILSSKMPAEEKQDKIVSLLADEVPEFTKQVLEESYKNGSRLAEIVRSGSKGSPGQFNTTVGAPLLYTNHKGDPVPIPVFHSIAEGLDPVEYWASMYGTRQGTLSTKMSTAEAGDFGKKLGIAAHRLVVTEDDCGTKNGIPVDGDDPDNVGTILQLGVAGLPAGTVIRPEHLKKLKGKEIVVRSPMTCQAHHGLCSRCSGIRETGKFPEIGDNIGVTAAAAMGERLSQNMLSCLAEGTLVRMADMSCKPIEEVQVGERVIGSDEEGNLATTVVTRVYDQGTQPCTRYVYKWPSSHHGNKDAHKDIVCTPEHKVLARHYYSGVAGTYEKVYPVPIGALNKMSGPILSTSFDDTGMPYEPRAWLLGSLLGDGCFTKSVNGVHFSCADEEQMEWMRKRGKEIGVRFTKYKYHDGIYYGVASTDELVAARDHVTGRFIKEAQSRNPVQAWLEELGIHGHKAHEKTVPGCVYTWNNQAVAEFLAGLFGTDGSVYRSSTTRKPAISYNSASRELVEGIWLLLCTRFGIHPSPIFTGKLTEGRNYPLNSICITRYTQVCAFNRCIPLFGCKKERLQRFINEFTPAACKGRSTRIVSKEEVGLRHVYDIEVANQSHLFLLENGMIVSNSKHTAGALQRKAYDFYDIERLFEIPKSNTKFAPVAETSGRVTKVEEAPTGGKTIYIGDQEYWVSPEQTLNVKQGDVVDAGDVLSDGIPNPSLIAEYRGIGDARLSFLDSLKKVTGGFVNRRNGEVLARALVKHMQATELEGPNDTVIDDIFNYDDIVRDYEPREGSTSLPLVQAQNSYLEQPALHYTIGTKVTPRVVNYLKGKGVKNILVNKEPPNFRPVVQRMRAHSQVDPDWMTRLYGYQLKKTLPESVHRAMTSDPTSTSFVPGLARGVGFGDQVTSTGEY